MNALKQNNLPMRRRLMDLLTPHVRVAALTDLSLSWLRSLGITGLLFDLDNTILGYRESTPTQAMQAWIRRAQEDGFKVCLLSNARNKRLSIHANILQISMVGAAQKPRRRALRKALSLMGLTPSETAMIGDQVFTDVLVGNRLGLFTVLVTPIAQRDGWLWMPAIRKLERWLVRHTPDRVSFLEDEAETEERGSEASASKVRGLLDL